MLPDDLRDSWEPGLRPVSLLPELFIIPLSILALLEQYQLFDVSINGAVQLIP
jgi:hypothetical protein